MRDMELSRASWLVRLGPVAVGILVALVLLVLPMRGATFLWDDWCFLGRALHDPWPRRWLEPEGDHWSPMLFALLELEFRVFGPRHVLFMLLTVAIHALNVFLLERLLAQRTGDAVAGALGATAFAVAVVYREVIWWAELAGLALALTTVLLAFLELQSAGTRGSVSRRTIATVALATFLAPCLHGMGLALGPALALEALVVLPAAGRGRAVLAIATSWVLYLAILREVRLPAATRLPHDLAESKLAAAWFVSALGEGVAGGALLLPGSSALGGAVGAALYAAAVGLIACCLEGRERRSVLLAQVLPILVLAMVSLKRWSPGALISAAASGPTASRYEYLPVVGWTVAFSHAIATGLRARPRATGALAGLLLALLAWGHAGRVRNDPRIRQRNQEGEFIGHLVRAATSAKGPVFDALLSDNTRASQLVSVLAPDASVIWTEVATRASLAPYERDPYFHQGGPR